MDPKAEPITKGILYYYDYGDDWKVTISLIDVIKAQVASPVCIAADGLPVLDDVGSISGFCEMLKGINGDGSDNFDYKDPQSTKAWAKGQGWTGRQLDPAKML